jgi:hypothetical protein
MITDAALTGTETVFRSSCLGAQRIDPCSVRINFDSHKHKQNYLIIINAMRNATQKSKCCLFSCCQLSRMSTPSHIDDIDNANTSTSTAAASTTTINDGRTKHRRVGADDDDAPLVAAGAQLSAQVDAATTSNGSSSGGKRKQAPGMICVVIVSHSFFFSSFLFFQPMLRRARSRR